MDEDILDVYRNGEFITIDTGVDCFDLTKEETIWLIAALATAVASDDDVNNKELLN